MKIGSILFGAIIISYFFTACKNNEPTQKEKPTKKSNIESVQTTIQKTNYELLQGKWQSEDDSTNFLVFEKNIRKEIATGMDDWDSEEFILSDHCENESNQSDNSTKEKDSYISCKESDLCWYIMYLNEKGLTLQYLGRGNTLTYKRVDEYNLPLSWPSGAMAGK